MSWWWYAACILLPDLGMLGYLVNEKIGAYTYNLFHHIATGVILYFLGMSLDQPMLMFTGVILLSHTTLDRIFGYGLKYEKGFKFTHLGEVGR